MVTDIEEKLTDLLTICSIVRRMSCRLIGRHENDCRGIWRIREVNTVIDNYIFEHHNIAQLARSL